MKAVILILVLVAVVQATSLKDILKAEFNAFKLKHHKTYKDSSEELKRLQIFVENKKLIDTHNKRYLAGEESYEMGVNKFSDMTPEEFKTRMLTNLNPEDAQEGIDNIYNTSAIASLPSSVDWRLSGAVNPVKNQGTCAACWAFSAVGSLESHHFINSNQRVSLSEQNLVDCTRGYPYNNRGCTGGWPIKALNYVRDNGGINTASSYPYEGRDNTCRYNKNNIGSKISAVIQIARGNEAALASAVANKGPISVCLNAALFQYYKSGVLNNPSCSHSVDHSLVVIGYGTDSVGGDYWLVRNSWGENWGENGYIRMARNRNNQCAIASYAIYPVI
ncbi:procathepsin L-like [Drosophila sulfurigaster albostrigata]|uniref:procathepsin L-like n=1 Tax=Drosophila sulfurigaster albostrigata TaxID=89887 RepID=UPI002D21CA15|nr:procathepsin L-like [Drosophila sulfurigaster albostrigata]